MEGSLFFFFFSVCVALLFFSFLCTIPDELRSSPCIWSLETLGIGQSNIIMEWDFGEIQLKG